MLRLTRRFSILLSIFICTTVLTAGTPGSFRGTIVDGPQSTGKNWIYVQGKNGMARRVDISHAQIAYDEDVPAATRLTKPEDSLAPGAEVRVTAEQDSDGEWKAARVEILKAAASEERRAGK